MPEALRLFLAIEPDPELRRGLSHLIGELKRESWAAHVRWVRSANLHLTLRFLGDVAAEDISGISGGVRTVTGGIEPFRIGVHRIAPFPTPRRPHAIVGETTPCPQLFALASTLEQVAVSAGLAPERRPFSPHFTLGRLIKSRTPHLNESAKSNLGPMTVGRIVLLNSEQTERGRTYTPLEYFPLGKSGSAA
ncbi:RNA 2',3'-cyclic phosphodiesterase [Nocardia sp. NEAU-G5]|uniref:RNA 2',3'-cyclic phosphodiesterase n=1 Tax=Nocardia albiluteola TaxID=2842303 RepID=A0ABS6AWF3_9NOCA|nr:RNA 2',3'-cyclic phosphodiesterase [Nocardia albiluteola]MBU3061300.1 RNA 2',3'-cyclic phosphodiesterase [Nocardia albiluteola]